MSEKLKLIKVRPGKTGFYTKVLEAGEYGRIPESVKETADGWFDDVPEQEDHLSAAMSSRNLEGSKDAVSNKTDSNGGTNPGDGVGSNTFSNQSSPEKSDYAPTETALVGDAPSTHTADESANEAPTDESQKANESQSSDESDSDDDRTKSEIIKELEDLGVQDFNRSKRKSELLELLESVKAGLVKE